VDLDGGNPDHASATACRQNCRQTGCRAFGEIPFLLVELRGLEPLTPTLPVGQSGVR